MCVSFHIKLLYIITYSIVSDTMNARAKQLPHTAGFQRLRIQFVYHGKFITTAENAIATLPPNQISVGEASDTKPIYLR